MKILGSSRKLCSLWLMQNINRVFAGYAGVDVGCVVLEIVESVAQWCVVTRCRCQCPGRTFLGKRRYFSGIAALTPLTPLTYKQNAVNAFIPTKKTPLTPLYRQGTPLTLLYQKKLVSSKNWFSHSMKNEKLTVNHLLDKRLRSF